MTELSQRAVYDPNTITQSAPGAIGPARVPTDLECALYAYLEEQGIRFDREYALAGFYIDAFDPVERIAYEADGTPWHSSRRARRRDAARDEVLQSYGVRTVRLGYDALRPWLP